MRDVKRIHPVAPSQTAYACAACLSMAWLTVALDQTSKGGPGSELAIETAPGWPRGAATSACVGWASARRVHGWEPARAGLVAAHSAARGRRFSRQPTR